MNKNEIMDFFKNEVLKRNLPDKAVADRLNRIMMSENVVLVNYGNVCWSIEDEDLNEVIVDEDILDIIAEDQISKEAM